MTLVARRPFKYRGHQLQTGEVIAPEPEGRLRQQMLDTGYALRTVADEPTSELGDDGVVCTTDDCGRTFRNTHGLRVHYDRVHREV